MPAGVFIGADTTLLTMAGNQAISKLTMDKEFDFLNIYHAMTHVSFGPISNVSIVGDSSRNVVRLVIILLPALSNILISTSSRLV